MHVLLAVLAALYLVVGLAVGHEAARDERPYPLGLVAFYAAFWLPTLVLVLVAPDPTEGRD